LSPEVEAELEILRTHQLLWTLRVPFPIEVLCYTPEEYERKRKEIGVVQLASQQGVDLLSAEDHE